MKSSSQTQDPPAKTKEKRSAPTALHLATGKTGEDLALAYLKKQGFSELARNWRPSGASRSLELDIVMEMRGAIVFIEVKTRNASGNAALSENFANPLHNFTLVKQRRLIKACRNFLTMHALWGRPCRFDLVCLTLAPGLPPQLEHHENVIELRDTLGSRHAPWQPW